MPLPTLALILPCYNEEEALPETIIKTSALLQSMVDQETIHHNSFILFVDDGSKDGTWQQIETAHRQSSFIKGLKLAGNAGHQNALLAGMLAVQGKVDCLISVDADLQDDINVIPQMLELFTQGNHIVNGVREERTVDSWFKRTTANLFYALLKKLGAPIIPGHADFRLISSFALQALADYPEKNLFLRGIFPSMGLASASVTYTRKARMAGETKYPFWKMCSLAIKGITVCSPVPLRLAALLSAGTFVLALLQSIYAIIAYLTGQALPGWTSLVLIILYLGSVQLFCIAILGEYLAKIFVEVMHRPRYLVEKDLW